MAERVARLYGPGAIGPSATTLFTVPTGETYIVRGIHMVGPIQMDDVAIDNTLLLAKTALAPGNHVYGTRLTGSLTIPAVGVQTVSLAFTEGETVVAGTSAAASDPVEEDYDLQGSGFLIASASDLSSYPSAAFDPNSTTPNAIVLYFIINQKATTPDVATVTDAHANASSSITSISTIATSTIRGSIFGGATTGAVTDSAVVTVAFSGNTQTACFFSAKIFQATAFTSSIDDYILQTATNSGTTETTQSVTMTPSGNDTTAQILFVGTNGVNSSYTPGTGGHEVTDGGNAAPMTGSIHLFAPAVTNPEATIASAGTSWVANCIEIPYSTGIDLTLTGIIID